MLIRLDLSELEIVIASIQNVLATHGEFHHPDDPRIKLHQRLSREAKYERSLREPVKVAMHLNGSDYLAMLNPVSGEVEVRFNGKPGMSGKWGRPWRDWREPDDADEAPHCIRRDREYEGMPQPDDDTLEVLSAALRHALARR